MSWTYILGIIGIAVIPYLIGSLRVLRQYERGVVFLFGKFEGVGGPGLTFIFVPIQQMVRVSLRTVTMQIPSQKIITKDNVSIDIGAVAYSEKAVIAIENVYNAINQISQTTERNVVGRFSLDQLLSDTPFACGGPPRSARRGRLVCQRERPDSGARRQRATCDVRGRLSRRRFTLRGRLRRLRAPPGCS
jgi:hypothetical protein